MSGAAHICYKCGHAYASAANLRKHYARANPCVVIRDLDGTPNQCQKCGRKCGSASNLRQHEAACKVNIALAPVPDAPAPAQPETVTRTSDVVRNHTINTSRNYDCKYTGNVSPEIAMMVFPSKCRIAYELSGHTQDAEVAAGYSETITHMIVGLKPSVSDPEPDNFLLVTYRMGSAIIPSGAYIGKLEPLQILMKTFAPGKVHELKVNHPSGSTMLWAATDESWRMTPEKRAEMRAAALKREEARNAAAEKAFAASESNQPSADPAE